MGKPVNDDDLMNMSDEELMNLDPNSLASAEATQAPAGAVAEEEAPQETPAPVAAAPVVEEDKEGEPAPEGNEAQGAALGEEAVGEGDAVPVKDEGEEAPPKAEAKPAEEAKPVDSGIDYKAMYEKLTAPFKANGREFAVKDVDDAIFLL